MFCKKCGKKLADGAKFCPACGAASSQAGGAQTPVPSQDVFQNALASRPAPAAGGAPAAVRSGNRKLGLFAGAGAAAVLAVVLVVVLFSGLLGGPKAALGKAVAKSAGAYQAASDAVGMPDLKKLGESKKIRTDMSFQIKSLSDELTGYSSEAQMLKGLGMSLSSGMDLPGRKMDFSAAVSYGSASLITFWGQADDDVLSLGCPELLDNKSYGLSTATLGKDLDKLGAGLPEGMEDMSFNLFDIVEAFSQPIEVDQAAQKALFDAIEAEETGKTTMDVNDHSLSCTGYRVTIPKDAMRDYIGALEDAYKARELDEAVIDLLRSMGMPKDELSQIRSEIKDAVSGKETFDVLKEIVKTVGDIELDVYVSGGYIAAVVWEDKIEGERVEVTACFGGGKHYADDLSLEMRVSDVRVRLESTGNHGTEGVEYTDSSSLRIQEGDYSVTFKSELEYYPKRASDNFEWTVKGDGFSLTASGQLTTGKDSLFLDLDKLSVNALGTEMLRLGASYSVGPYSAPDISAKSPVMLSSMDEDDFMDLASDITANAQSWAMGLMDDVPELSELFW